LERRFAGSNPAEGNEVLRTTKISSTPSFGAEVKPEATRRKVFRHVKISLANMNKNTL
jgi:hypothetical protein